MIRRKQAAIGDRRDGGMVLVELALLAPVIVVLLGAAVDLGLLFRDQQELVEALRVTGNAVSSYIPSTASPGTELCQIAKRTARDTFGESAIGSITVDLENIDLNSGGAISGAGPLKAVKISIHRGAGSRPSFFASYSGGAVVSGTFYLESQTDVDTGCTP